MSIYSHNEEWALWTESVQVLYDIELCYTETMKISVFTIAVAFVGLQFQDNEIKVL